MSQHKSIGIDPGSSSWRITVLSDEEPLRFESVPTRTVVEKPRIILDIIEKNRKGLESVAAPSGYGLPLTTLREVGKREIRLLSLKPNGPSTHGLRDVLMLLQAFERETEIPCFVLPSVKHLPTVPRYRKINRVDMGTPDKVCSALSALQILSERRRTGYGDTSFVLCEVGQSFSAYVCVKEGRIVDGIGGTETQFGTRAPGTIDAELLRAMVIRDAHRGGMVDAAGLGLERIEEQLSTDSLDRRSEMAIDRFTESLSSDAIAICSRNNVREIVLSTTLGEPLKSRIVDAMNKLGLRISTNLGGSASLGAAFIANGLVGGRYSQLCSHSRIREGTGTILDEIYIPGDKIVEV